jgi:hypothetical protein
MVGKYGLLKFNKIIILGESSFMNSIKRYVPAFVTGSDDEQMEFNFETLDQLKEIPFIKQIMNNRGFRRLFKARDRNYLMVEYIDDKSYVIVFIERPEDVDLPID